MHLNLTYKNPVDDFQDSLSYYENGTINIKYTLVALRDKLGENIQRLDRLIEMADDVSCIMSDEDSIIICIDDEEKKDQLQKEKIIRAMDPPIEESESDSDPEYETHTERLRKANNLLSSGWNRYTDRYGSDSDSESSEVAEDIINAMSLLNYYDEGSFQ